MGRFRPAFEVPDSAYPAPAILPSSPLPETIALPVEPIILLAFFGIGAVPGALIGAGIGAVGSWFAGNKIKEDYEEKAKKTDRH